MTLRGTDEAVFRTLIRKAFTDDELDQFRRLESAMLPGPWRGRRDVRDSAPRSVPCQACDAGWRPCRLHICWTGRR